MEIKLQAQLRDLKNKLDAGQIAAVIYGAGVENKNLQVKRADLEKAFASAGESNLIDLEIAGAKSVKVLVKEVQHDPIKGTIRHIDFYQVNMNKKITTEIPLHFIGESKAVKELGGMLVKNMDHIEVECLPNDLVDHIDVDVSIIKDFHQPIKVSDLPIVKGMELLTDPSDNVVMVTEPKAEEVFATSTPAAAATPTAAEADKNKGDKKEEKKDKK